jgi:hypothetical protein
VHDLVESVERLLGRAERLLVDDAGALGQPVLAERPGQLGERDRRHGQVVDELGVAAQRRAGLGQDAEQAAGITGVEAAAGEQHALRERLPGRALRLRPELGQHVMDVGTEVLVPDVAAAVPDQQPLRGQQSFKGQPVERRQHHALGQVTCPPEEDKDRRAGVGSGMSHGRHGT